MCFHPRPLFGAKPLPESMLGYLIMSQNTTIPIHENELNYAVCKMAAILSRT